MINSGAKERAHRLPDRRVGNAGAKQRYQDGACCRIASEVFGCGEGVDHEVPDICGPAGTSPCGVSELGRRS
jgi:hypothetical protein